ncbi:hypothetical protein T03_9516 [Trichinella britovi]|uniref:Uncharacterized protein n=1 Tax=Trichinella britovi TaxID=45882 RepID=A0A0V1C764_TRIBR|nr:hypothetical protein T03_9516 [Trichinella britovi]
MANDERRWKLFISNRVKEIQDLPQLLETLYYERQSSRLGQQGQVSFHYVQHFKINFDQIIFLK